ncbi:hypothetical protein [Streptacidiphilus neutrinimicus]|uniref:hypothetical protein n=1 Tax=Streptacidiphilus neutrinimicus TaxID=105420 RepID=UPI0005A72CB1|nr:hypothetical protein [Streptacidiphilus neutrinimicus]
MTTAALPARSGPAVRRGLRPRGVTWLTWRQTRLALLVVTLGYLAALAYLLYQRHQLDVMQARYSGLQCDSTTRGTVSEIVGECGRTGMALAATANSLHEFASYAAVVPGLLGAALAAQPLAADFEHGRHLLLWSQSVSPRRWFTQRLVLPAAVLVVLSTALSAAMRWAAFWSHPASSMNDLAFAFPSDAMVPVYPLLTLTAIALGALVGLLWRRVIPALGTTLALYGALLYGIEKVRPYLLPFRRTVFAPGAMPGDAWAYDFGPVVHGKDLPYSACDHLACENLSNWTVYHSLSQFGPMLWVETGVLAVLTVGLVALAYRRLLAVTR